ALLATKKEGEGDLGVHGRLTSAVSSFVQELNSLLPAAAETDDGCGYLHRPWHASDDVVVHADDHLGVGVVGIEFEHALVIVTRSNHVAQRGEPRLVDKAIPVDFQAPL